MTIFRKQNSSLFTVSECGTILSTEIVKLKPDPTPLAEGVGDPLKLKTQTDVPTRTNRQMWRHKHSEKKT